MDPSKPPLDIGELLSTQDCKSKDFIRVDEIEIENTSDDLKEVQEDISLLRIK